MIAGLNFLGSLGQIEALTLECAIVRGPLALNAGLCVVPILVQYMGAGAAAAVTGVALEIYNNQHDRSGPWRGGQRNKDKSHSATRQ